MAIMKNPAIKFRGTVVNGHKVYYKPTLYQERLKQLEGKQFVEILDDYEENVTPDQHAYYRSCIRFLINEVEQFGGWDEKELHQYFMKSYFGATVLRTVGNRTIDVTIVPSTAELSKKEMSKYIEWFTNTLAQQEAVILPEPSDVAARKYSSRIKHVETENSEPGKE